MIELGRRQKLQVVKKVEFGVYLGEKADAKEQERVLLPAKQVPADTKVAMNWKYLSTGIPQTA